MVPIDCQCDFGRLFTSGDYRAAVACLTAARAECDLPSDLALLEQARHDTMAAWWRAERRTDAHGADDERDHPMATAPD